MGTHAKIAILVGALLLAGGGIVRAQETATWREQREVDGRLQWVRVHTWRNPVIGSDFTVSFAEDGAILDSRQGRGRPRVATSTASKRGEPAKATAAPRLRRPASLVSRSTARDLARIRDRADLGSITTLEAQRLQDARHRESTAGGAKAHVVGLTRDLPTPVVFLGPGRNVEWELVGDGGWLARATLISADAESIRVQWRGQGLPAGAVLSILDSSGRAPNRSLGSADLAERPEQWAASVAGDTVVMEVYLPSGADPSDIVAELRVDQVAHTVKNSTVAGGEGPCHNNLACPEYSGWSQVADSVAMIKVISGSFVIYCTGALLNDNDPATQRPFLLTANHCVSTQAVADTAEFYWFFESTSCGTAAIVTDPQVVLTDGGGTLLATASRASSSDFTLLELDEQPPPGAHFAGWSTSDLADGADVTSIHHPVFTYKRISLGDKTSESTANYWSVTWAPGGGVTEQGSSGGPLLNAGLQIVGQLWGGGSHCGDPDAPDEYGKFSATYPYIASYIDFPVITVQPAAATELLAGQSAQLTTASAGTDLTRQWYQGDTPGTGGTLVEGATSADFTTPALSASTSYWLQVSNVGGTVYTDLASITVFANAYYQWASHEGIPDSAPALDPDFDGISNELEYILDFDPRESSVAHLPMPQFAPVTGLPMITFPIASGLPAGTVIAVYSSDDLVDWDPVDVVLQGTTVTATAGAAGEPTRYFQIRGTLP